VPSSTGSKRSRSLGDRRKCSTSVCPQEVDVDPRLPDGSPSTISCPVSLMATVSPYMSCTSEKGGKKSIKSLKNIAVTTVTCHILYHNQNNTNFSYHIFYVISPTHPVIEIIHCSSASIRKNNKWINGHSSLGEIIIF
jgi:hypothetical protein